ncbi:MAG: carotenoid biosynthesis protein, partial [Acidimicrobiales bacterium]
MASTRWLPESPGARSPATRPLAALPAVLAGLAILAQIAYPLTHGHTRTTMTIIGVVIFFAASTAHATLDRGARVGLGVIVVTAGGGLLAEALGVATGVPFGRYRYTHGLGWSFLGVPVVIPLAWTMMSWPALIVGRRVAGSRTRAA